MTAHAPAALPHGSPTSVELRRVRVDLVEPIVAAHGTESVREVVVVRVVGPDGTSGWGECDALLRPTYTSEWQDGAWAVLRDLLAPAALTGVPHGVVGHPMAVAALETALVDLALRGEGRSLAAALGATSTRVASRAVVGIGPVDDVVAAVARRVESGHRAVKLKIRPGHDVAPLRAVRAAWPDLVLAADANGSYDLAAARDVVRALAALDLHHLEQPLGRGDLLGHAEVRRSAPVPIALDESAVDLDAVATAAALGAVDLVNLKPARLGGPSDSLRMRDLLVERGLTGFCGGMYELGIGRAAALAVAVLPGLDGTADLGPSDAYVRHDITPSIVLGADGTLGVPDGPGLGTEPDPDRLEAATVEHASIR